MDSVELPFEFGGETLVLCGRYMSVFWKGKDWILSPLNRNAAAPVKLLIAGSSNNLAPSIAAP